MALFVFVVLEDLVVLVPFFWIRFHSFHQINCSIKCYLLCADLTFVAVEYKTVFLCYLPSVVLSFHHVLTGLSQIHMSSWMEIIPFNLSVMLSILIWNTSCDILSPNGILRN